MNNVKRITKRIKNIFISDTDRKYVFMSDMHLGELDNADQTVFTKHIILYALKKYWNDGYTVVLLGDTFELAEQHNIEKIKNAHADIMDVLHELFKKNQLIIIRGNHDAKLKPVNLYYRTSQTDGKTIEFLKDVIIYDAALINDEILAVHGHQNSWFYSSWFNNILLWLGPIWRKWQFSHADFHQQEATGWEAADKFDNEWDEYGMKADKYIVAGHSHKCNSKAYYINAGTAGTMQRCITCVEFADNRISTVKYQEQADMNGIMVINKTDLYEKHFW